MIVKKIANPRKSASKAVRIDTLAAYIRAPEATSGTEKCAYYAARGFFNDNPATQAREMIELAEAAPRSADPITHYVLSYGAGERPTPEQIEEAVDIFLEECGRPRGRGPSKHDWTRHQVMYALHTDTDNDHVHLVINRVDPDTEHAVRIDGGWDVEVGHRAGVRIEEKQGWSQPQNKRYRLTANGNLERVRPNASESPRQPTQRQVDAEHRTGEPSAARIAIERAGPVIEQAKSWTKLHTGLHALAMRYERTGSGAKVLVGNVPIKASRVARRTSLRALEERLGAYEPAEREAPRAAHPKDAARLIEAATSWDEVHTSLDAIGLVYERIGSGAAVRIGDVAIKASEVARGASLRRLETRLGPFVPAPQRHPSARAKPIAKAPAQNVPTPNDAAPLIDAARTWGELYVLLAAKGLGYERKGSGAIVRAGDVTVKASLVSRNATLAALERRLGAYEPAPGPPSARDAPPALATPELWNDYRTEQTAHAQALARKRGEADEERDRVLEAVRKAYENDRAQIAAQNWRRRGDELNFNRALFALVNREKRQGVRERHREALTAIRAEHPGSPSYTEWLARRAERRGKTAELVAHARAADARVKRAKAEIAESQRRRRLEGYRARTAEGRIDYVDRRDEVVFQDDGNVIRVRHAQDEAAVLAAMRLAAARWDQVQVSKGTREFRELCARLGEEHGLAVHTGLAPPDHKPAPETTPVDPTVARLAELFRQHASRDQGIPKWRLVEPATATDDPDRPIAWKLVLGKQILDRGRYTPLQIALSLSLAITNGLDDPESFLGDVMEGIKRQKEKEKEKGPEPVR